jgi:hypothetical protein
VGDPEKSRRLRSRQGHVVKRTCGRSRWSIAAALHGKSRRWEPEQPITDPETLRIAQMSDDLGFPFLWEAMARREIRQDASVLGDVRCGRRQGSSRMNTCVITGAASGIGAGLARHAASLGMKLVLADWNEGR